MVYKSNIDDIWHGPWYVNDIWHGPGVVIGSDGKQVTVDHGGYYVRVHIVWLSKVYIKGMLMTFGMDLVW